MPRANWNVLTEYPMVLPKDGILKQFNDLMQPSIDQIVNLIFKNINLKQTRDLLLPRLISGKIDVSELEIDIGEDAA